MNDTHIDRLTKAIERLAAAIENQSLYPSTTTAEVTEFANKVFAVDVAKFTPAIEKAVVPQPAAEPTPEPGPSVTTVQIGSKVIETDGKLAPGTKTDVVFVDASPKPEKPKKKIRVETIVELAQKILERDGLEQLRAINKKHGLERLSKTPEDKLPDVLADLEQLAKELGV